MADMLMAISNLLRINDVSPVDSSANAANAGRRAEQPQAPTTSEPDRTDLSGPGRIFGSALKTLGSLSSVRPELVAELKANIATGNYQPDAAQVAQAVGRALRGKTP